jgi:hypothetical protein
MVVVFKNERWYDIEGRISVTFCDHDIKANMLWKQFW